MTKLAQTGRDLAPGERRPPIKLLTLLVIASEAMLFAGFISAFVVFRADRNDWPPLGQPLLPAASTAFNTLLLLISAMTTWMAVKKVSLNHLAAAKKMLGLSVLLGLSFLLLQGREWLALMSQGLGIENNPFGAFFYIIVGMHALHVMAAIIVCLLVFSRTLKNRYTAQHHDGLVAFSYFWYFVVALWPPLYFMMYLW